MFSKPIAVKAIVVSALAACALGWVLARRAPPTEDALRIQLPYEPATLDFSSAEDGMSLRVLSALMKGLVSYDENNRLRLDLARSVEVLEGGLGYRFRLRPWRWSDGRAVRAGDFVYAIKRTLDPATPSKLSELLFFVKGAREYKVGKLRDFSRVGVLAPRDDVLEFRLAARASFFPHILTLPVAYPQREDDAGRFLSTGPYRLARWLRDQRFELERNPESPASDPASPARIVFQIVAEEGTALGLFEQGKLDVLFQAPALDLDRLRARGLVKSFPYFAVYYLAFDQRQKPWDDRLARTAVARAIDRAAVIKALGGSAYEANGWIPRGFPGHGESIGFAHDAAAARADWLRSNGKGVRAVELGIDSGSRNRLVAERAQADLKSALGIDVQVRQTDWKAYLALLAASPSPVFRFGFLCPFIDPYACLLPFQSDNPNNYTGWKSAEYDALLERIAGLAPEDPSRQALVDRAHRLLVEQAIVVPIYHYIQEVIASPRVNGFEVNGLGAVDWAKVRLPGTASGNR